MLNHARRAHSWWRLGHIARAQILIWLLNQDEHRTVTGGIGHNLLQEAPEAFAKAVIDVDTQQ